jgi:hypothetical protein
MINGYIESGAVERDEMIVKTVLRTPFNNISSAEIITQKLG